MKVRTKREKRDQSERVGGKESFGRSAYTVRYILIL